MHTGPIGIFDSGIGGTTIWREIRKILPHEDTLYLADSLHAPYGEKSAAEILRLSIKNTDFLLERGCKLIVVACNTATTNAISFLRETYTVPFIGIEPAIKPAALRSYAKKVGVLATKGTLASDLFHSTAKNHASGISIIEKDGAGLVPLIEAGKIHTEETKNVLQQLLQPMIQQGIDYLVLGCTHYPYLIPVLKEILPQNVEIIDSGAAVAKQTHAILQQKELLNPSQKMGRSVFYTNLDLAILTAFLKEDQHPLEISRCPF
ncbi:glutamate racemase [Arenibacter sp. GZD96]|uniref:glutamate racemase n=1 Tax=Aurantibrevibacter litoralis TaxID=3106030 RepID=UPI002AFED4CB|nr:glutamate racemase [Arenibacter sp. GZD-96]MEA1784701.1 glutamate racemase [Arenibacter sp. GZD-96]